MKKYIDLANAISSKLCFWISSDNCGSLSLKWSHYKLCRRDKMFWLPLLSNLYATWFFLKICLYIFKIFLSSIIRRINEKKRIFNGNFLRKTRNSLAKRICLWKWFTLKMETRLIKTDNSWSLIMSFFRPSTTLPPPLS